MAQARGRIAGVAGARVAVVAVDRFAGHAIARFAAVAAGATVAVAASRSVQNDRRAFARLATLTSARVFVVAIYVDFAVAAAADDRVIRAFSALAVADIDRARILVIAHDGRAAYAEASLADIDNRA